MGRIEKLPQSVVNRIAAGEVVERPASVVKELLENALDAGPGRIDVALDQGGIALVRVVDDGGGIEADDLPLAVAAHATSKLRVAEDLERIETLGFRGEALASIGEVARLVIRSRPPGAAGAALEVDGGRVGAVLPHGGAVGTTVEVHQLFGNVPARRAFLRAPQTEWSHSADAFVRTSLAHPAVAFSLAHNGRTVHDLPAAGSWLDRIAGLFGAALAGRLLEVEADDGEVALHGYVGRPEDDMAGTRLQHLFVAGRPFRDRSILHAVQEAYRSRLYRLVLSALRSKFLSSDMGTRLVPPGAATPGPAFAVEPAPWPAASAGRSLPWGPPPAAADHALAPGPSVFGQAIAESATAGPLAPPPAPAPAPAADAERAVQMHDRYIVVETSAGIEVIDQHALHERLLYERLKAAVAAGGLEVQRLLVPESIELSAAEMELVAEHAATLGKAGMQVEGFGGSTVIVTSKPALAGSTPAATLVREVLGRLAAAAGSGQMLVDEVLHGMACKAAIKAGDPLSSAEVAALVRDRRLVPESHHCPHGRPTSLTLTRRDLDRQFRRT
ncbi:MAG: DNA mismatch repair endonuclease MutL [Planctomycetaceae bacterium]|nr:DNA mismatch repair endonuclease MutL [Planctomycetaceae bacterium]